MITFRDAGDVSHDFDGFVDGVLRRGPSFVQHGEGEFAVLTLEQLDLLLTPYRLTLEDGQEANGSFSGGLAEIDLVSNATNVPALKRALAQELRDYAQEYLDNFDLYFRAPNRRGHLPYVLRALLQHDAQGVAALIDG